MKSCGDEHAPCLTPFWTLNGSLRLLFSLSALYSLLYALFKISTMVGSVPVYSRRLKSISRPTLSKAFCRSMRIMCISFPRFSCICVSSSRASI